MANRNIAGFLIGLILGVPVLGLSCDLCEAGVCTMAAAVAEAPAPTASHCSEKPLRREADASYEACCNCSRTDNSEVTALFREASAPEARLAQWEHVVVPGLARVGRGDGWRPLMLRESPPLFRKNCALLL
ncbi:MAG: hypothetical protein K8J08_13250 [Thermoanaerobaculia bacterium]|nr:hypothetical protein [Thermoanaerobaculia bacterium]